MKALIAFIAVLFTFLPAQAGTGDVRMRAAGVHQAFELTEMGAAGLSTVADVRRHELSATVRKAPKPPCPGCPKRQKAGVCAADCPPPAGLAASGPPMIGPRRAATEITVPPRPASVLREPELPPPRA